MACFLAACTAPKDAGRAATAARLARISCKSATIRRRTSCTAFIWTSSLSRRIIPPRDYWADLGVLGQEGVIRQSHRAWLGSDGDQFDQASCRLVNAAG